MMQSRIRVLSVDDHPLVREGITRIINDQPDMMVVAIAATGCEAVEQFAEHRPDIILLDLRLPDISGIEVLNAILARFEQVRALMLTTSEGDVEIQRALQAGALGYLLKSVSPGELTEAIRLVYRGEKYISPEVAAQLVKYVTEPDLTNREIEVLSYIAKGNRNRDIGTVLNISEETVKTHISHIMEKLKAQDRAEAIAIGIRRGILHL